VLLRLPGSVKQVFEERVRAELPLRAEKILHRIRETRGGALYDSRFQVRGRGEGAYADAIEAMFEAAARRYGLLCESEESRRPVDEPTTFVRPQKPSAQLSLL
jgi:DNA repair photolyase